MAGVSRPAKTFTPRQGQYLAFIHLYTRLHRRPPAETEMQDYFRVSPPSVHQMVLTLEQAGFIRRQPRTARSIELLVDPTQLWSGPLGADNLAPASGARGLPGSALSEHGPHQNDEIEPGNADQIAIKTSLSAVMSLQAEPALALEVPADPAARAQRARHALTQPLLQRRPPRHELESESVIDHGEPPRGERDALPIYA